MFHYVLGDDGGPLFLFDREKQEAVCLYGVISVGKVFECGDPEVPSAAARVFYYMDEGDIEKNMDEFYFNLFYPNRRIFDFLINGSKKLYRQIILRFMQLIVLFSLLFIY